MPTGICKLCLMNKRLAKSHLMPAALYETCRAPYSEPIKVSSEIVLETSRQTQDYLLCDGKDGCEEVLNSGGENWTLPMLMRKDRTFPLYDILAAATPEFDEPDLKAYSASKIPAIDVAKLTHFAMGIFWKASIHTWKKQPSDPRIKLGPYSEAIRRYLRGETGFPDRMVLAVDVGDPTNGMILFTDPVTGAEKHSHFSYVPGVLFTLMVGGTATAEELKARCFATNVHHPIVVSENLTGLLESHLQRQYFKAPKSRKLIEAKKRRAAALSGGT